MPFPADGVDVLNGMTERAKSARRDDYEPPRGPGGGGSGLGTPGALLLLAILLFILKATGSAP